MQSNYTVYRQHDLVILFKTSIFLGFSQFSARVYPEFAFDDYKTSEELEQAITEVQYRGVGVPKLGKALKYVTTNIFTLNGGAREGTPKVQFTLM